MTTLLEAMNAQLRKTLGVQGSRGGGWFRIHCEMLDILSLYAKHNQHSLNTYLIEINEIQKRSHICQARVFQTWMSIKITWKTLKNSDF